MTKSMDWAHSFIEFADSCFPSMNRTFGGGNYGNYTHVTFDAGDGIIKPPALVVFKHDGRYQAYRLLASAQLRGRYQYFELLRALLGKNASPLAMKQLEEFESGPTPQNQKIQKLLNDLYAE